MILKRLLTEVMTQLGKMGGPLMGVRTQVEGMEMGVLKRSTPQIETKKTKKLT